MFYEAKMNNTKIFALILLITIVGEFLVPFILNFFYPNYQWKKNGDEYFRKS